MQLFLEEILISPLYLDLPPRNYKIKTFEILLLVSEIRSIQWKPSTGCLESAGIEKKLRVWLGFIRRAISHYFA